MVKRIHHVAIAVRNLEEALRFYRDSLGLPLGKVAEVKDQGVRAALLRVGESEIELLEPIDPDGGVARFLEKRGEGLHHICFATDDIEREMAEAKAKGLPLLDEKPRIGLAGKVFFLHPKAANGVLTEYTEPFEEE